MKFDVGQNWKWGGKVQKIVFIFITTNKSNRNSMIVGKKREKKKEEKREKKKEKTE